MSLLGGTTLRAPAPRLPEVEPWSEAELLRLERDTTGRYWSSHPLAAHEQLVRTFASHTTRTVRDCPEGTEVVLGGLVLGVTERIIQKGRNEGKRMARFRIEDFDGTLDAVMFSEAFQRFREVLADGRVLFFSGDVDASREETSLRVSAVHTPEEAPRELAGSVHIRLGEGTPLQELAELVRRHRGARPLVLAFSPEADLRVAVRAEERFSGSPSTRPPSSSPRRGGSPATRPWSSAAATADADLRVAQPRAESGRRTADSPKITMAGAPAPATPLRTAVGP
jgi:DNA polymerase-3 subunit alpha